MHSHTTIETVMSAPRLAGESMPSNAKNSVTMLHPSNCTPDPTKPLKNAT